MVESTEWAAGDPEQPGAQIDWALLRGLMCRMTRPAAVEDIDTS